MMGEKFSYSFDQECFWGDFDSREAAIEEAKADRPEFPAVFTCRQRPVNLTLHCLDAGNVIDWIVNGEDDLMIEQAEDWPASTKEQDAELTAALQQTFRDWMARHKLEPQFWIAEDVQEHIIEDIKKEQGNGRHADYRSSQ